MKPYRFNQIILAGLVLLFVVQNRQANEGTVKSLVTNKKDHPVEFASAVLLNSETSETEKEVICNEDGEFVFEKVSPGEYVLSIRLPGFESINQTIEKTIILQGPNQETRENSHCVLNLTF